MFDSSPYRLSRPIYTAIYIFGMTFISSYAIYWGYFLFHLYKSKRGAKSITVHSIIFMIVILFLPILWITVHDFPCKLEFKSKDAKTEICVVEISYIHGYSLIYAAVKPNIFMQLIEKTGNYYEDIREEDNRFLLVDGNGTIDMILVNNGHSIEILKQQ